MSYYPDHGGGGYGGGYGGGHSQQPEEMMMMPQEHQGHQIPSMTIDEMRILHRTALAEADAKRTELRLVLASRYRELVGSSDEVIHMRERAEELNDLVLALPGLVDKVARSAEAVEEAAAGGAGKKDASAAMTAAASGGEGETSSPQDRTDSAAAQSLEAVRAEISRLPRDVHRRLDENDVHGAAATIISLFDIIAARSDSFPLATALSSLQSKDAASSNDEKKRSPPLLETQMKMVYLHVQTLPGRTVKLARRSLLQSAAKHGVHGAYGTAAALSALDLLDVDRQKRLAEDASSSSSRAAKLIDLYYNSKARLLNRLLNKLTLPSSISAADAASVTNAAEIILSKIVLILQYDVILHPFQIFVLRKFPVGKEAGVEGAAANKAVEEIMSTLPLFDPDLLKSKASRFLAAHLPLIRTKVKTVLKLIAGTTASKLGQIRQTLYDKTDGAECMAALDGSGVCSWDEAVGGMVDVRVVSHGTTFATTTTTTNDVKGVGGATMNGQSHGTTARGSTTTTTTTTRRFSLWGALFSNTFSSLVHSLLTTSFTSVHVRVVSTLRLSLARAPPFERMLPHEAHRNALRIATDLDASLRRVSDDAHELLVHAEEREESERRLRQSLYVQTCEIMGRLLNELRRMLVVGGTHIGADRTTKEDATKVLIVGRLCHLLKFRLKSLPTLLDPKSSPAVLAASGFGSGAIGERGTMKSSGMITLLELSGSFDLADDDDDGLISFDEAMEAMESAFSGTHFHGAEMVRDTLLLSHAAAGVDGSGVGDGAAAGGGVGGLPSRHGANESAPRNVTLSELALLSARGLRHDASGPESALGTVQSSLDNIVHRCFKEWARAALSPPLASFTTTLRECIGVASTVSDVEWKRLNGLIEKEDDVLLKQINESKGDFSQITPTNTIVGEVSPHVVSYLLAVAGVLNRSVCPADSLPPVPSVEYAEALGISPSSTSSSSDSKKEIPNMMILIRGSLLGEAVTSMAQSLKGEIMPTSEDDYGGAVDDNGNKEDLLKKFSSSSLIQLTMDVQFIHQCFFERNRYGFLLETDSVNDSREVMSGLSERLSDSMNNALKEGSTSSSIVNGAISQRHSQVFASCDLFLSSLLGEDKSEKSASSATVNGMGPGVASVLSSSQSFILNPLPSSRRFILLPIQAEKSLTELQLRGKYGKKGSQDDHKSNSGHSKDGIGGLGTGFGFLSSML
eukprot:CAMPEP_0183712928 /NCGR_PEP_ID=MMETSP0737-20130205/7962_1 /TAXON_ID=385413 /ORGANISM="Thalassiosira miniscula, Strain CCMP1093" /LENGTH=1198 /DNA_ID=CAMNT_0025941665 /DNA_START=8 /DNA_END=3601 /DNA_ORIENTATION=+